MQIVDPILGLNGAQKRQADGQAHAENGDDSRVRPAMFQCGKSATCQYRGSEHAHVHVAIVDKVVFVHPARVKAGEERKQKPGISDPQLPGTSRSQNGKSYRMAREDISSCKAATRSASGRGPRSPFARGRTLTVAASASLGPTTTM